MNRRFIYILGAITVVLAAYTNFTITKQLAEHPLQKQAAAASFGLVHYSSQNQNHQYDQNPSISHGNNNTTETISSTLSSSSTSSPTSLSSTTTIVSKKSIQNSTTTTTSTITSTTKSKILGFADSAYTQYALRWYHRLESLGYSEHVIVTVDSNATLYFQQYHPTLRVEELPYKPCISKEDGDSRMYRRQIFGRRWKYVHDQLQNGYSILLTDVDNVFYRYVPLTTYEESNFDVFHAYSTSYPTYVFEEMGFTVCGGMSWLRAVPKVIRFVGTLINKCNCRFNNKDKNNKNNNNNSKDTMNNNNTTRILQDDMTNKKDDQNDNNEEQEHEYLCKNCFCDDQVVLNEMLWKGKHSVVWDTTINKPTSLHDFPWEGMTGISKTTKHSIQIWDRNFAYRAPLPETCPPNNWVAMPLYVNRDVVVDVWDNLCSTSNGTSSSSSNSTTTTTTTKKRKKHKKKKRNKQKKSIQQKEEGEQEQQQIQQSDVNERRSVGDSGDE